MARTVWFWICVALFVAVAASMLAFLLKPLM